MKITLNELSNSTQALKKLSNFDLGNPKLNFKFMGLLSEFESETKKFVELQKKIIEKYRDSSISEEIRIPLENIDSFNKEIQEAGSIEVELDWEAVECEMDVLTGFTANDMQCLNGKFIDIKGE